MNNDHFAALLTVELRRSRALIGRLTVVVVGLLAVFVLARRGTASNLGGVLLGSSIGYVMIVPMAMARDRIDGVLEFLRTLPTSVKTVTAAKFAATSLAVLPGAVQGAIAFAWLVRPRLSLADPVLATAAVFFAAWILLSLVGWWLLAVMARFELKTLFGAPILVVAVLVAGLPPLLERTVNPLDLMRRFLANPAAPTIAAIILFILVMAGAAGSFWLANNGIARFRPRPDEITL